MFQALLLVAQACLCFHAGATARADRVGTGPTTLTQVPWPARNIAAAGERGAATVAVEDGSTNNKFGIGVYGECVHQNDPACPSVQARKPALTLPALILPAR